MIVQVGSVYSPSDQLFLLQTQAADAVANGLWAGCEKVVAILERQADGSIVLGIDYHEPRGPNYEKLFRAVAADETRHASFFSPLFRSDAECIEEMGIREAIKELPAFGSAFYHEGRQLMTKVRRTVSDFFVSAAMRGAREAEFSCGGVPVGAEKPQVLGIFCSARRGDEPVKIGVQIEDRIRLLQRIAVPTWLVEDVYERPEELSVEGLEI